MTTAEPRTRPTIGQVVLGLLLVGGGVVWLIDSLGYRVPWDVLLPVGLILVGGALVAGSRQGAHGGLIAVGVVLTLFLALGVTVRPVLEAPTIVGGVGERTEQPLDIAALSDDYRMGVGSLTVDLSGLDFPEGTTTVEVSVGIGEAMVIVPSQVTVVLDGRAGVGEIRALGEQREGIGLEVMQRFPGDDPDVVLELEARVGIGELEVRR